MVPDGRTRRYLCYSQTMAELPASVEQTKELLVCAKNRTNDPLLREKLLSALEVVEAFYGQIVERDLLRKILKEG